MWLISLMTQIKTASKCKEKFNLEILNWKSNFSKYWPFYSFKLSKQRLLRAIECYPPFRQGEATRLLNLAQPPLPNVVWGVFPLRPAQHRSAVIPWTPICVLWQNGDKHGILTQWSSLTPGFLGTNSIPFRAAECWKSSGYFWITAPCQVASWVWCRRGWVSILLERMLWLQWCNDDRQHWAGFWRTETGWKMLLQPWAFQPTCL